MRTDATVDAGQFRSHVDASRREEDLFDGLYEGAADEELTIAGRRRRRLPVNAPDSVIKTISLVEEDGTLFWRDGVPARSRVRRRGRRRGVEAAPEGSLVLTKPFRTLAPNKIVAAVGKIDQRLNDAIGQDLHSRLRRLRRAPSGFYELQPDDVGGPFHGRTLLLVHGTFVSASSMLAELTWDQGPGKRFLERAMSGPKKYDRVLFFDHATLSVSPMIHGLELGRAMSGSSGQIDVIAHSRGGLVVRWWLEAFGRSLSLASGARVRAVLAGSPLYGTSLAAPDKIQNAMSLISNVGTFAEKTLSLVGLANPFVWVSGKILEVIVSVTGALAKTPILDALAPLLPGLAGQSAVSNNHELNRLRLGPSSVDPEYYAIVSNFETEDPKWRFWRNFRKDRAADLLADTVFPGDNDLVVDTDSMIELGVPKLKLAGKHDYKTSSSVWHCNYFRQQKTVDYLAECFRLPL